MNELSKITAEHLRRCAIVYVRPSSTTQVEHNRESTARQYELAERAARLSWRRDQVKVIDEDLGVSGSGLSERTGFARMTAEVGLGQVGIVLGLEVSRLARNNADWYRLLDLCGLTHTLIGDGDGIYHPGLFNDRLVLGLKGTMSEAELHVLRARLLGGIRNKAARGELHRGLPVGLVRGDADGEVLLHPDEAVQAAIHAVFDRFAEFGSARRVWLWFRSQGLRFPLHSNSLVDLRWVAPTYTKIHQVLTNPFYAGVYAYGRTQQTCCLDAGGRIRKRIRQRDREQWPVFIRDHHAGYIDWNTFEANQKRLAQNIRPRPHQSGGAVREGAALLQGLAVCGHCGRRLAVHYSGRGEYCLNIGGVQIDAAVAEAFLAALAPAGLEASLQAIEQFDAGHETTLAQFRRDVERARYNAQRAERRYRAVDPENRLVARGLEAEWESALLELKTAESELSDREHARPRSLTHEERDAILALGKDLKRIWFAPTTSDRDRKELLRTLLDDVTLRVERDKYNAHLTLRWRGGLFSEVNVPLPHSHPSPIRTADDTIDLLRRLAAHYPDTKIAGILNRQGRTTATGLSFTANRVSSLRTHWEIPCFEPKQQVQDGECMTIEKAARALGIAPSTLHRCLNDGFIAGEQITPGAPWRIRINDELRSRFVESAPEGYVKMFRAMNLLGVSRQTILQRVKRGELKAVHVYRGRAKGIRIQVPAVAPDLFDPLKKN
ncbi:recombinase family protein [Bradyrhizobium sp. 143]|uniref:recombinase family protein n=1 Tax=Bradyrhizobium sp. 143 TaxID=2782619 RepID=UPI001FF9796F|nr:recombinase family protein [Bradyrhizobium sp. 143]MCK1710469.1 recombinase family protein [Bradyrhizobium sp. 143]